MEIRQAEADEHAIAGRITASAYRGLVRDEAYLERIADVSGRAGRTVILVAIDDGAIVGSLTLELDLRVNPDDDPLEKHRAHIRMLGVDPHAQGLGIGTQLMRAAEQHDRGGEDGDDASHHRADGRGAGDVRPARL
jgi:ribosomal protein S18 acetylase RimI-like enzyme